MALENPVFEASYRRLFGEEVAIGESGEAFFRDFYVRFLQNSDVAAMFEGVDLERQIRMLRKSLYQLIASYLFDEPSAELKRLATLHRELAVTGTMFDLWLESLVDTVSKHDPKFDSAVGLAWCWALTPGITYMKLALSNTIRSASSAATAGADQQ